MMHHGMCFHLAKQPLDFNGAKKYCAGKNSHLIIVDDDMMNRFLEGNSHKQDWKQSTKSFCV
jgi:hypothetical protein